MAVDLAALRTEYARAGLAEPDLDPSPLKQLERWLHDAIQAQHPEPTAMTLATVDERGDPNARLVLLKGVDHGLQFFTNYESRKGRELGAHPRATAVLFWVMLERQVRARGDVAKLSREESEAYFASRPRDAKLGAWASAQSSVLAGREELDRRLAEARERFRGDVPCPPFWGGYRLVPDAIEFWQGRPSRLHDRLRYTRIAPDKWTIERLSP